MTNAESFIPAHILPDLISADIESGELRWKHRGKLFFKASKTRTVEHVCNNWNSQYAGQLALNSVDGSGHLTGRIFNRLIYAHRAMFALVHGNWPTQSIDHINGNPADNRPCNLRDVSHKMNLRNQSLRRTNTTGISGVYWNKRLSKWAAAIVVDGRSIHLGFHDDMSAAAIARYQALDRYGFHHAHGRRST